MSNYNPPCLWVHMDYDEADFSSRFAGNPDSVHPLETRAEIGLSRFWPTVQADASSGAMILPANEQRDCADTDKPERWLPQGPAGTGKRETMRLAHETGAWK